MSAAMARKRRAESSAVNQSTIPTNTNPAIGRPNTAPASIPPSNGLTLPQVISVIDTRLIVLETFMKESKDVKSNVLITPVSTDINNQVSNDEIVEEMDTRFDILAREIADLKDVVLKLQAYTMDVNKTLLEERIHILSDLGTSSSNTEDNLLVK